jgi:hypothetical protein
MDVTGGVPEHYEAGEWWTLHVSYILASDPIVWMKWAALEGR